jgi:hypothetical protein
MSKAEKMKPTQGAVVLQRADGITQAERYLKQLCDRSFLSLWSYSGVYRDQGQGAKGGDGKEICDLLVVFQDHVIMFSDKDCAFPETGNLELDWSRWYKRAVLKSAEQVWGAERWIKSYPGRIFLDRACTQPFPIDLPAPATAKFHRIVVAHDASRRCREELGGSGSLMITPDVAGAADTASVAKDGRPFMIGQVDPARGYVHVFDDTTLEIVMGTLDTVSDFVEYLTKKEQFILSGRLGVAAGEEELLAFYLKHLNEAGEHDFVIPSHITMVGIEEGLWEEFTHSPERLAQLAANEVSYSWDALIETFSTHVLAGTQYYTTHPGYGNLSNQEKIFRLLAREPRIRRRLLARSLLEAISSTSRTKRLTRVMMPSKPGDPYYIFLLLPHLSSVPYEEYREVRMKLLEACCIVTRLEFPEAEDIVGIATESGRGVKGSEDAFYYDARVWTEEHEAEARSLQKDLDLLTHVTKFQGTEQEYPMARPSPRHPPSGFATQAPGFPRKQPCPCGSGKKYKRCCGDDRRQRNLQRKVEA